MSRFRMGSGFSRGGRLFRFFRYFRLAVVGLLLLVFSPIIVESLWSGPSDGLDIHAIGPSAVRSAVYLVLIFYGPLWRGVAAPDVDRARVVLCAVAATFELVLVQRLFLF